MTASKLKGATSRDKGVFCMVAPVNDWITGKNYGCLIIEIDTALLTELISFNSKEDEKLNQMSSFSCVTDEEGYVLASLNRNLVGKKLSEIKKDGNITSSRKAAIPGTPLDLNLFFIHGSLFAHMKNYAFLIFGIALIVGVSFYLIILCTNHS